MQGMMDWLKANVDGKQILNGALAIAAIGAVAYVATRSGIKPLADAAKIAANK